MNQFTIPKEEPSIIFPIGAIIEDVKSNITRKLPVYKIKSKILKAIYNITILET